MPSYSPVGPAFGWKRPPASSLLATAFDFTDVRPDATVESEAGISVWPVAHSGRVFARVVDDSSGGRLTVSALTVYDRVALAPEGQPPGSGPMSRLVPVTWSDGTAVSVRRGQALGVRLRYTAGPGVAGGRSHATVEVVADGAVVAGLTAGASDAEIDPTIQWSIANQWGIQLTPNAGPEEVVDPLAGAWMAGHVQCALVLGPAAELDAGLVLAGTNGGGIWQIDQTTQEVGQPQAQSLTDDWQDTPFINALCQGPYGPEHIYAAAWGLKRGSLRETTNLSPGDPTIHQWREINLPPDLAAWSFSEYAPVITQIVVTNSAPRRIVISVAFFDVPATGLYWATIPAPGGVYAWTPVTAMADGSPFQADSYFVAAGAGDRIIAAGAGTIFWGDWSAQGLLMNRADIQFGANLFPVPMGWTSVAVAPSDPGVQYAVAAVVNNNSYLHGPPMLGVFKSTDNGQAWVALQADIGGQHLPQAAGFQGTYNNCIAVSPFDPEVVAVGWESGHFVSRDGGQTFSGFSDPSLHADVHGLYFDPWRGGERLYICSDGGICLTADRGATFDSSFNRNLANLQCYATYATRDFYGTLDATSQFIAAGLQDNGNVYCLLPPWDTDDPQTLDYFPFTTPWMQAGGGDGGGVLLLPTSQLCFNEEGRPYQGMTIENAFPPYNFPFQPATIPVQVFAFMDAAGIPSPGMVRVPEPSYANARGELMYAVAAPYGSLIVCGLFSDDEGGNLHWEEVGTIGSDKPEDAIAALAPLPDGSQILVATRKGLSALLVPVPGDEVVSASPVPINAGAPQGLFTRIVFPTPETAFAAYNWSNGGIVLGYDGQSWQPTAGRPPVSQYFNDGIYGLAVNKGFASGAVSPPLIFASTNDAVYVSRDRSATWLNCSVGLPACPQGADIQCADGPAETSTGKPLGGTVLYLGTWGRSVWMASLNDAQAAPAIPPILRSARTASDRKASR